MARFTHAELLAKMGAVAVAHHELRRASHRAAKYPEPPAPPAILPTGGAQPRKDR